MSNHVPAIRLLLIGDVHLPESTKNLPLDQQDTAFPLALGGILTQAPFSIAVKEMIRIIEKDENFNGIVLCGDLTSKGDLSQYDECVRKLNDMLSLKKSWGETKVHITPGNHDINRKIAQQQPNNKFTPLQSSWTNIGLNIFPHPLFREAPIEAENGDQKCVIYSLNSCLGCGEIRGMPEAVAIEFKTVLENYERDNPQNAFSLLQEQLDTPAVDASHLSDVCDSIKRHPPNTLPIILAHHNLLSQDVPRLAIYTDIINGGVVRSRLSSLERPVVYIHGHIHSDPVEIISNPKKPKSECISISVDCISNGFTTLSLFFSRDNIPIGLTVERYVIENNGAVDQKAPLEVCIRRAIPKPKGNLTILDIAPAVVKGTGYSLAKLLSAVKNIFPRLTKAELIQIITEGYWERRIEITGFHQSPDEWRIGNLI